jgi:hypothetical protein
MQELIQSAGQKFGHHFTRSLRQEFTHYLSRDPDLLIQV